jgi:hypothetical protein
LAELTRAIRAAEACGKVAVQTPLGIAFVESEKLVVPSPDQIDPAEVVECDKAFGVLR